MTAASSLLSLLRCTATQKITDAAFTSPYHVPGHRQRKTAPTREFGVDNLDVAHGSAAYDCREVECASTIVETVHTATGPRKFRIHESDGAPDEKERRPKHQPPGYQACMMAR